MIMFKRWYTVFRKYVGRCRSGQIDREVSSYMAEDSAVKAETRDAGYRSESKTSGRSPLDVIHTNQSPENHTVIDDYPVSAVNRSMRYRSNQDIDSTGFSSLEGYAEGLSISEETIAKWISAGILSPRETEVAEKVIRIMRKKARQRVSLGPFSPSDP